MTHLWSVVRQDLNSAHLASHLGILDHCLLSAELLDTEHHVETNFLTAGCQVQSLHCAQRKLLQGGCGFQVRISWALYVDVTWLRREQES